MTFNPCSGYSVIRIRPRLPEKPTVIELGSQTMSFSIGSEPQIKTVEQFYENLGFTKYDSIDFDGFATIHHDLNWLYKTSAKKKFEYDLVTNNGTGEHIFCQASVFENMHNFCKVGGIMLHILPWINWMNHGFYNFHPVLFHDLATDNNYEVADMFASDRDANLFDIPGIEEYARGDLLKDHVVDRHIFVVAALKKRSDEAFVMPTQTKYRNSRKT